MERPPELKTSKESFSLTEKIGSQLQRLDKQAQVLESLIAQGLDSASTGIMESLSRLNNKFTENQKVIAVVIATLAAPAMYEGAKSAPGWIYSNTGAEALKRHDETRFKVERIREGDSWKYVHEDAETTEVLNFLAGQGEMPASIRVFLLRKHLRMIAHKDSPLLEDIDTIDKDELERRIESIPVEDVEGEMSTVSMKGMKFHLPGNSGFTHVDTKLYERLWTFEQKIGSPKIRILGVDDVEKISEELSQAGRGPYVPEENTIYLNPELLFDNYMAESAHSYQYHTEPVKTFFTYTLGIWRSQVLAAVKQQSFRDAFDKNEYDRPGSLEYQAHKEIEPKFKAEFKKYREEENPK